MLAVAKFPELSKNNVVMTASCGLVGSTVKSKAARMYLTFSKAEAVGEGDVKSITVVGQGKVVPSCDALICALEIVSSHKADVCQRCGHPVVVPLRNASLCEHRQRCNWLHVHSDVYKPMYLQTKLM